ncbi:MAG TPA: ATPase, T2SS/T4P/T4SS family, partial [Stellaceae bacterium]|nr:ATPase, T2SS/T4P/T4SS family [Stellaceae bacterium]
MTSGTKTEHERRERNRTKVNWRGKLMTARGSFDCRVLDLSPGGALVRLIAALDVEEPVTLFFSESERIEGVVAWTQSRYVGIRFAKRRDKPIPEAALTADAAADPSARLPHRVVAPVAPPIAPAPRPVPSPEPEPVLAAGAKPAGTVIDGAARFVGTRLDKGRASTVASQIQSVVMDRIDVEQATRMSREALVRDLEPLVGEIIAERALQLNTPERAAVIRHLVDEMIGFGPLEPLLADETISDILVDGPKRVYVERAGKLEPTDITFGDDQHVMNVATRIVTLVGRRIDESSPLVDARLPDGSRVNVIIPPLALDGPMISIRKFTKRAITLAKMVDQGNISQAMAAVLTIATKARLNVLVSGGTGSGKTTLLNALSQMIDPTERIITIEDAAELQLQQPRVGRLETRIANLEGKGAITIRDLFRNALRMRPDRIIVGEIRGSESMDMLQAMNSGHDGSLGTIHASGPREALTRLENLLDMSGVSLPTRAARAQIATALDMIVQVSRMGDGKRRVTSIMEVIGMEGEVITTQELFTYQFERLTGEGNLKGSFVPSQLSPHFLPKAEYVGLGRELVRAMN